MWVSSRSVHAFLKKLGSIRKYREACGSGNLLPRKFITRGRLGLEKNMGNGGAEVRQNKNSLLVNLQFEL